MAKKDEVLAEVTEAAVTEDTATADKEQVIYMGPNSVKYGLTKGTVYIDGMPVTAKEALEEHPLLYLLFVPINRIAEAEVELQSKGSAMHAAYDEFSKGGRN